MSSAVPSMDAFSDEFESFGVVTSLATDSLDADEFVRGIGAISFDFCSSDCGTSPADNSTVSGNKKCFISASRRYHVLITKTEKSTVPVPQTSETVRDGENFIQLMFYKLHFHEINLAIQVFSYDLHFTLYP